MMEDVSSHQSRLLQPLVDHFISSLPSSQNLRDEVAGSKQMAEANRDAIIKLSVMSMSNILTPLAQLLQLNMAQDSLATKDTRQQSQLMLMDTMTACLEHQWDVKGSAAEPVDDALVDFLSRLLVELLTNLSSEKNATSPLLKPCKRLIAAFSLANFAGMYRGVEHVLSRLASGLPEEQQDLGRLVLVEHMHFNTEHFSQFIRAVAQTIGAMKKLQAFLMAGYVCTAFDSWLHNYSEEFVALHQRGHPLVPECQALFMSFASVAEKTANRKVACWPAQMRMLLLCPNLIKQYVEQKTSPAHRFMDSLKKALSSGKPPLYETSMRVFVCAIIASAFLDASSTLHIMLFGVEADLKERVFSSTQPLPDSFSSATGDVLVPSLVAFFRLNHKSAVNDLMERFLSADDSPVAFQIATVKALIQVAPHHQPYRSSLDEAQSKTMHYCYQKLSRPLRRTLCRVVRDLKQGAVVQSAKPTKKKEQTANTRAEQLTELVGAILDLFCRDPAFAFHHEPTQNDGDGDDMWYGSASTTGHVRDKQLQDTQIMFHNVCTCALEEKLSRVADQAVAALVKLHSPGMIPLWRPGKLRFWEVSSDMFITISTHVTRFARGNELFVLNLLKTLMSLRNSFVQSKRAYFATAHELERWTAARTQLEIVLLTNLCSVDREVVVTTKDCIGLMCEEARLLQQLSAEIGPSDALTFTLPVNHDVFSDIAKLHLSAASAGLRATHKQIVKVLRDVVTPSKGTESAWELIYRRTKSVLDSSLRRMEQLALPGKDSAELRPVALPPALPSMLYFLCSLGGVCNIDCIGKVKVKGAEPGEKPQGSNKQVTVFYLTAFISQLLNFLAYDSDTHGVELRETIKDALGHELHAVLVPFVFDQLLEQLSSYFDKEIGNYTTASNRTTFVDQAIGIIHLNFSADNLRTNQYLALADMESLLDAIMEYLRQVQDTDQTRRVKIGFCKLVVLVMNKRHLVTFKQEMRFRNKLLDRIISFVSTSNADLSSTVLLDLDIAAVQALAALLHGLPLQPLDDDVADPIQVRSSLFLKYFTFLMNVTNRCNSYLSSRRREARGSVSAAADRDTDHRSTIGRRRSRVFDDDTVSLSKRDSFHGHHLRKRQGRLDTDRPLSAHSGSALAATPHHFKMERIERLFLQLRDSVTHAMSNLLGANVEVGLSHAIGMGYHQDAEVRLAFTEVLNKVLHQGAEFDMLSETVVSDRYAKLLMLITKPDLQIVFALDRSMPTECMDALAQVLVRVFHSRRRLIPLCVRLAEAEVMSCRVAQSIFRRNSLATKVCTAAIRMQGKEYLRRVVGPLLTQLLKENGTVSYEVDESKLGEHKDQVEENAQRLCDLAQSVLDRIFSTIDELPETLRAICWDVRRTSESLFPDAGLTAVGGLVFLRFFTPAIVSPVSYEMLPPKTKLPVPALRALLLLSKMLQALANNASFSGVKEAYMQRVNGFIVDNMERMQSYLSSVADPSALSKSTLTALDAFGIEVADIRSPAASLEASVGGGEEDEVEPVTDADLHALHRMVFENLEKIGQDLAANARDIKDVSSISSSLLFDQLATLLAQLGDPPKATTTQGSTSYAARSRENKNLEDFLARHEFVGTSTEDIEKKQVFFRSGMSKDKRPVFYLIARRYRAAEIDGEQLLYFIFLTLKPLLSAKFDLVLDLTAFSRQNEPSELVLAKFLAVVPPTIVAHVGTAYFVNASSSFKQFAKRVARHVTASKFHKVIRFVNEVELQEFVPNPALPASTHRLTEATDIFSNVTLHQTNKKTLPVVFKVGSVSWQVVSAEKVKLFTHAVRTVDVFPVADLVDVFNSGMTDDGHVRILYRDGESLILSCGETKKLDDAVSQAWTRYLLSQPENKKEWKVMRPADVPATLLNMALLNLGSANAKLRLASYNLLANATTTFNFHIGGEVMEASSLVIPENNNNFIIRISECLSHAEPGLTLEFLDECITGIRNSTSEQKHICLEYMEPWLPRLCEDAVTSSKVAAIIKGLVDMTIHEKDLYPSLQATVWSTVARVDELARLVIREFMSTAVEHGPDTQAAELLADAAVSLGSVNASLVAQEVVAEVLRVLRDTGSTRAKCLSQHKLWPRLRVLARFLLKLSFNNCLDVQRNLPDIWFIVTMMVAVGPPSTRAVMHAIVTNVTQSMCTSLQLEEERMKALRIQLENMALPKLLLQFGVSSKQPLCDLVNSGLPSSDSSAPGASRRPNPANASGISGGAGNNHTHNHTNSGSGSATGPSSHGVTHATMGNNSGGAGGGRMATANNSNNSNNSGSNVSAGSGSSNVRYLNLPSPGMGSGSRATSPSSPVPAPGSSAAAAAQQGAPSSSSGGAGMFNNPLASAGGGSPRSPRAHHHVHSASASSSVALGAPASSSSTTTTTTTTGAPTSAATAPSSVTATAAAVAVRSASREPRVGLVSVQSVVDVLHDIVCEVEEHAQAWRRRWLQLLLEVARDQSNTVLRPRAFVALGVITPTTSADLMALVLGALGTALSQEDVELADAILACLARLLALVEEGDFDYHMLMFWVSLAILQVGIQPLYSSALSVLETTVNTMEDHGVFASRPVADVVLAARTQARALFDQLEQLCGLSFTGNFSFAMSATLLRAFDHPNPVTILRARRLLAVFFTTAQNAALAAAEAHRPPSPSVGSVSTARSLGVPYQPFRTRPSFDVAPRPQLSMRRFSRSQPRKPKRSQQQGGSQASGFGDARAASALLEMHEEAAAEHDAPKPARATHTAGNASDDEDDDEEVELLGRDARHRISESSERLPAGFASAEVAVIPRKSRADGGDGGTARGGDTGDDDDASSSDGNEEPAQVSEAMLGYVCALLPIDENVQESFVNPFGEFKYRHIISAARDDAAALMLVMMCAKLGQSAHQLREQAFLLEFLAEFAELRPAPFALVEEELLEMVQRTLRRAQDAEMVRNCHRLIRHLVEATLRPQQEQVVALDKLGFSGLWSASSFPSLSGQDTAQRLQLCGRILAQMLSETQRSRAASASVTRAPKPHAKTSMHVGRHDADADADADGEASGGHYAGARLGSLGVRTEARRAAASLVHGSLDQEGGQHAQVTEKTAAELQEQDEADEQRRPTLELTDSSALDSCV